MPVITKRPISTISAGTWALTPSTGSSVHAILSDDVDTTFLSTTTRSQLPNQFAVFDIADLTTAEIPVGSKIASVTLKQRVLQVTPAGGSSFLSDIIRFYGQLVEQVIDDIRLGTGLANLFRHIFGFPNPTPPAGGTATWQTVTVGSYPGRPSGGEWTLATINALTWRLGRSDSTTQLAKVSEFYIDVDYNQQPTVAITGPTSPITTTTRPVVKFTYDDPEGDPQDAFRARVFTAAQVASTGFDVESTSPVAATPGTDGWVPGQDVQWLVSRDLPNGTYTVYVQARQTWKGIGNHSSAWASYAFTQTVPGPPTPALTATANSTANWVQLDLIPSGPDPATETYNIYASDDAGITYQLIWGGWQKQADGTGLLTIVDHLAPLNQARWYKAFGFRTLNGIRVASDESNVATAVPVYLEFALKDPLAPSFNQAIGLMDDQPERTRQQGTFTPLVADGNVAYPIVVNGPLSGIRSTMDLLFLDADDTSWTAFEAIRASGRTLLLQYPTGEQHWIQIGAKVAWSWRTDGATGVAFRIATVEYTEVAAPVDPTAKGA